MEIISLELSGFKNYEAKTSFNFKDKRNNLIFDMNGAEKSYFFEAILGTIFGFTSDDKLKFRGNPTLNKTFTAMITLALDQRTMIIERDFETDFVACLLSDTKTTRSIFQGKDFADNGFSRPYLQMLRSVFPIIDKELFIEVCYKLAGENNGNFSDLLEILYSLLTPQFKFSNVKYLVSEGHFHEQECLKAKESDNSLSRFQGLHEAVLHMLKMKNSEEHLEKDVHKLEVLISELKERYHLSAHAEEELGREYAPLLPFNPLQLRADILIWKSLLDVQEKNDEQRRAHRLRKEHIENILKHDLYEYTKLSDDFSKDAQRFKERKVQISYAQKTLNDYEEQIDEMTQSMSKYKLPKILANFLGAPLLFLLSYFLLGPVWIFIVPETIIAFFIILALSSHSTYKTRNRIYHYREETHILEKRIREAEKECRFLLKKSHLFKNGEFIDSHVQRFKKCRQYQRELRMIEREDSKLLASEASGDYQRQIAHYKEQYGAIIDINRRDLETYLDNFVAKSEDLENNKQDIESYPAINELQNLCAIHRKGIKELRSARKKMTQTLKIENGTTNLSEILDKLDRKIKNIKMNQNMNSIISLH